MPTTNNASIFLKYEPLVAEGSASTICENSEAADVEYEKVHTVIEYWDRPRSGIADYNGAPHYYECVFNEPDDEWSTTFLLRPIDAKTFALALEDWQIWRRWETAYYECKVTLESQPALPEDLKRHAEISVLLRDKFVVDPDKDLSCRVRLSLWTGKHTVARKSALA